MYVKSIKKFGFDIGFAKTLSPTQPTVYFCRPLIRISAKDSALFFSENDFGDASHMLNGAIFEGDEGARHVGRVHVIAQDALLDAHPHRVRNAGDQGIPGFDLLCLRPACNSGS
jgi:hypothetical protein